MVTAILTALLAVLVFLLTQSFLMLVLEPVQEQRRLIGEVASALTVYEKSFTLRIEPSGGFMGTDPILYGASREEAEEADKALRELAGRLRASLWSVPFYDVFALLRIVPKLADVVVAANELQMWYSQLPQHVSAAQVDAIKECRKNVAKRLGIAQRLQVISPRFIDSEEEFFPMKVETRDDKR